MAEYALNSHNAIDFRVAAFQVLRYYENQGEFKIVGENLLDEFANFGPRTKKYIDSIARGKARFIGVVPLEIFEEQDQERK